MQYHLLVIVLLNTEVATEFQVTCQNEKCQVQSPLTLTSAN